MTIHYHQYYLISWLILAIIIEPTKIDDQIEGVVPHLVDGGQSIFQYIDDTILFMQHDLKKARHLKLIL
jgi:hypothetical protein